MTRYIIYLHTCRITGKSYIGQTSCSWEQRWRQHISRAEKDARAHGGSCRALHAAIRKYGTDAWEHRVLDVLLTGTGANRAEQVWIERFQSLSPNGYNLQSGGGAGRISSPETRAIRSRLLTEAMSKLSPEERSERSRRASMTQSFELRSRSARKGFTRMSAEAKSQIALRRQANLTPAQRSEIAGKRAASVSPEQRRESARRGQERMTPEQRHDRTVRGHLSMTPEQRSERSRKSAATRASQPIDKAAQEEYSRKCRERAIVQMAALTPEQRSQMAHKAAASRYAKLGIDIGPWRPKRPKLTAAERSEVARKRMAAKTPEERRAMALKSAETKRRQTR